MLLEIDKKFSEYVFKDSENLIYSFNLDKCARNEIILAENGKNKLKFDIRCKNEKIRKLVGPESFEETLLLMKFYDKIKDSKYFVYGNFIDSNDELYDGFFLDTEVDKNFNIINKGLLKFTNRAVFQDFFLDIINEELMNVTPIKIFYLKDNYNVKWFVHVKSKTFEFLNYSNAKDFVMGFIT